MANDQQVKVKLLNPVSTQMFLLFLVSMVLGLMLRYIFSLQPSEEIPSPLTFQISISDFLLLFATASAVFFVLLNTFKGKLFLRVIFFLVLFQGLSIFLSVIFSDQVMIILDLAMLIVYWFWPIAFFHNLLMMLAISGIGFFFGTLINAPSMIVIMGLLSIYDYIAVLKSRHMVGMFKSMSERRVLFGLIFPYRPSYNFKRADELEVQKDFVFLGSGDVALPMMFVVSTFERGLATSLLVAVGATIGLVSLYILNARRNEPKAAPGLPMIFSGALIGYLVALLII